MPDRTPQRLPHRGYCNDDKMCYELASRADLCYNMSIIMWCLSDVISIPRRDERKANFFRMDSLSSDLPLKQCTHPDCLKWYPATPQYFNRHKRRKDGLNSWCKACKQKADEAYRNRPDVQAHIQEYGNRSEVKERNSQRQKAYRSQPDIYARDRAYEREYRSRPDIQQHNHEYRLDYFSRPDIQEREKERRKVYENIPEVRERKRKNHRAVNITHRARKKAVQGTHTTAQIQDKLKKQKYRCYYCNEKFEKKSGKYLYQIEHTFPISRVAGTDIPANDISYLVLACPSCNQSKHDKFPWEWHKGGKLL